MLCSKVGAFLLLFGKAPQFAPLGCDRGAFARFSNAKERKQVVSDVGEHLTQGPDTKRQLTPCR
jgi:hypothetical protein